MSSSGNPGLNNFETGRISYSDSKLHMIILAKAVAQKWQGVYANAVDPGWVPTKMGGSGAPDSLEKGYETQAWLAVSNDQEAKVSGCYFYHKRQKHSLPEAGDVKVQDRFLSICEKLSGVPFPE
jgi:NAD(P)-dependent dehydrogenase (short-subunit alcohol dehydrogenase family)